MKRSSVKDLVYSLWNWCHTHICIAGTQPVNVCGVTHYHLELLTERQSSPKFLDRQNYKRATVSRARVRYRYPRTQSHTHARSRTHTYSQTHTHTPPVLIHGLLSQPSFSQHSGCQAGLVPRAFRSHARRLSQIRGQMYQHILIHSVLKAFIRKGLP